MNKMGGAALNIQRATHFNKLFKNTNSEMFKQQPASYAKDSGFQTFKEQ